MQILRCRNCRDLGINGSPFLSKDTSAQLKSENQFPLNNRQPIKIIITDRDRYIVAAIRQKSSELGFLECGIVPAEPLEKEMEHLLRWLNEGMHGSMEYMARNSGMRTDPRLLFPGARTVIIVLQNYFTRKVQSDAEAPVVSKYAFGMDYHFVMKSKLHKLLQFIREEMPSCRGRLFVDSVPVLERAWARKAGMGWIGKNSQLISTRHGSYFFIGGILIDKEIRCETPAGIPDHCGSCTRCIDACPGNALIKPRILDSRRCISYLTIEHKGALDPSIEMDFHNRVVGCDICQDVCPWNSKLKEHDESLLFPGQELLELTCKEWHSMDQELFERLFRNSAVQRTGFGGLKRNLEFLRKKINQDKASDE